MTRPIKTVKRTKDMPKDARYIRKVRNHLPLYYMYIPKDLAGRSGWLHIVDPPKKPKWKVDKEHAQWVIDELNGMREGEPDMFRRAVLIGAIKLIKPLIPAPRRKGEAT